MEINDDTLDIFKDDVNNFATIDKLIHEAENMMKPIKDRIKELKKKKIELEKELCSTLDKNNLKQIESTENEVIIEYHVKQKVVPITKKSIKDKFIAFFDSGMGSRVAFNSKSAKDKALELYDYLYAKENRNYKPKEELKIKDLKKDAR